MAEAQRQFEIFVRNAKDEYVTTVAISSADRDAEYASTSTNSIPSKCVVVDYTRDPGVLDTRIGGAGAMTMVAVKDQNKLKSFRAYLTGRKKAGVVKLEGGGSLFLLPQDDAWTAHGESIVGLIRQSGGGGGGGVVHGVRNTARSPNQVPSPAPSLGDSQGSGGGRGGGSGGESGGSSASIGGFLGSLMGTLDETHKKVAGTAAVDRVNRAQEQAIKQRVERFKVEVTERLQAFVADPSTISHSFPHVEKSLRSIQHGLAEDFDGITTRTEGETDDRRVVAWKLGYEPPEEDIQLDAQVNIGAGRSVGSASLVSLAPMPAILPEGAGGAMGAGGGGAAGGGGGGVPGTGDLVRIGTVVKDRRTVQDIEEESRKRRRGNF